MWICDCGKFYRDKQTVCSRCGHQRTHGDSVAHELIRVYDSTIENFVGTRAGIRVLDDKNVIHVNQLMIKGAAGNAQKVVTSIQDCLRDSSMPLQCFWNVVEVKTDKLVGRVRRDFLIIETEEFRDYHAYISVRDFGIYLDSIIIFTVEPNLLKRVWARIPPRRRLDKEELSRPRNILKLQDFNAWKLVVERSFSAALRDLTKELQSVPSSILNKQKTYLDLW